MTREHLPLVKSMEETIEEWPKMSSVQKMGAAAACLVTAIGPLARLLIETKQGSKKEHSLAMNLAHIAVDLRDGLDGKLARATGGVTPLGKELDPLADKVDFFIQEIAQSRRGDLPPYHSAARIVRDIAVTVLRSHVMTISDGKANVGARWVGKASTTLRQVSLRTTTLGIDHNNPQLRQAHQSAATAGLIVSGAVNIKQLLDERAKFT